MATFQVPQFIEQKARIIGPLTILRTPVDIFPSINIPVVSVIWRYTGLASEEMEGRITSQFERAMTATVSGADSAHAAMHSERDRICLPPRRRCPEVATPGERI